MEISKQAALTCPAVLEHPPCKVASTELKGDRITYEVADSTLYLLRGDARSQLIAQIYKRARRSAQQECSK